MKLKKILSVIFVLGCLSVYSQKSTTIKTLYIPGGTNGEFRATEWIPIQTSNLNCFQFLNVTVYVKYSGYEDKPYRYKMEIQNTANYMVDVSYSFEGFSGRKSDIRPGASKSTPSQISSKEYIQITLRDVNFVFNKNEQERFGVSVLSKKLDCNESPQSYISKHQNNSSFEQSANNTDSGNGSNYGPLDNNKTTSFNPNIINTETVKPPVTSITVSKTVKEPSDLARKMQQQRENGRKYQNEKQRLIREKQLIEQERIKELNEIRQNELARQAEQRRLERERFNQDMQAQMEKSQRDYESLNNAQAAGNTQIDNGDLIGGTRTIGIELAKQGEGDAAIAVQAVGIIGQAITEAAKDKARRDEKARQEAVEKRRLQRLERERQVQEAKLKKQFYDEAKTIMIDKVLTIASREQLLEEGTVTKTYDKFSQKGDPIYFFFVESPQDYNYYKEEVKYPDKMIIEIKENVPLFFSPIIAVYPNSRGEYPFIKEIVNKAINNYKIGSNNLSKVYNWSKDLDEIENLLMETAKYSTSMGFIPQLSSEGLVTLGNSSTTTQNDYWNKSLQNNGNVRKESNNTESPKKDYWNRSIKN